MKSGGRHTSIIAALASFLFSLPAFGQEAPAPSQAPETDRDDVVVMSPFVVSTEENQGYYAENTLAGSRLRTNVADLASSISVVTLQQFEDTGSTDINDIFRFEANTEGSRTYTPSVQSLRNDGIVDVNAGFTHGGEGVPQTNATANRVRGIGIPGQSTNFYPSISAVPFDSYNIQSIEISRGPNSMLFGMGSPAGIVNTSTANAVLDKNTASITLRTDSHGSKRASIAFNGSLIPGKLAIMGAMLSDNREFERQPSYDKTKRQYLAATFQPFRGTTIRANFEHYKNDNNRPNTLTPRDSVSEWRAAGSPSYDPTTGLITVNGATRGPIVGSANSPRLDLTRAYIESLPGFDASLWNSAHTAYNSFSIIGAGAFTNSSEGNVLYTPGIAFPAISRPIQTVQGGQLQDYFYAFAGQYRQVFGTASNPAANAPTYPATSVIYADPVLNAAFDQTYSQSGFWSAVGNGVQGSLYHYPGVTDKSIYDWENVNILQMNFGSDTNNTYNVELEQRILDNLYLSAGWFKQDFDSWSNYTVSQLNVATLFVDTNTKLPDGRTNPNFGHPYVLDFDPDKFYNAEVNESYRAMLAFTPDFTRHEGFLKWLGHHQMLGLWSRNESLKTLIRYRMEHTDTEEEANGTIFFHPNPNNDASGNPTGWGYDRNGRSIQRWYYLAAPGDPADGGVTMASGSNPVAEGYSGPMEYYNWDMGGWDTLNMTTGYVPHFATTSRNQRIVDSLNFGTTSYFWKDRIIATFGVRKDKYKARLTTDGALTDAAGGNVLSPALSNADRWVNGLYQVDQQFNRWNYWDRLEGITRTKGVVIRPFKGWASIDRNVNNGSLLAEFISSLGFSYNESDNFNPPPSAQTDNFGNALPKPTGEGKDYGFQFSLFKNKLFARVNWFEATNENERTPSGTAISRFNLNVDRDLFRNWARTIAMINMGMDPTDTANFGVNLTSDQENQIEAAAAQIWQLPYNYYDNLAVGATRSAEAKGMEVQVTYNPQPNWTMKFTAGKQQTRYSNVLKEWTQWRDVRYPIWQAAKASDYLAPAYQGLQTYTTDTGREVDLTNFLSSYGFVSGVRADEPNGLTTVQLYYENIDLPQVAVAQDLEGQLAPGQRQWRWSFLTNYKFTQDSLRGWSVTGNVRWEDKSVIGYYGKPNAGSTDLALSDTTRPIYDDARYYVDLGLSYTRKIWHDSVAMKIQLNLNDAFRGPGLQVVGVNLNGDPYAYRIVDGREWVLQTKFEF